ncbi:MAG: CotH kinase family protein [Alistipes sp.]|nr:CotH kinase family protein [Alistipes senegalensis]MCM1250537.1 CotH kinase family protein [Alistipes sp.]
MKNPFLYLGSAALMLLAACSEGISDPPPTVPAEPECPVAPERIAFAEAETRLSEEGTAVVTLRVEPAEATVAATAFRLIDVETGAAADDFTFYPTGESDPAAGTYGMRITYKGSERKFRRCLQAHYGEGTLRSGELTVAAAAYTPVVSIVSEAPVVDKENWIAATIRIDGGNRFEDLAEMALSIRGRGNSTWGWEKKPYALKFAKKQEVLGMPKHKRWCLIADYMDRTHLRNRIAYHLGQHSRLDYTVRNEFAELYLNGEYQGCYLLTEQIKVDAERVNVSETDGFLLEFDTYFDEEVRFRTSASDIPVNVKSPDPEDLSEARLAALKDYLDRADEAVQALHTGVQGEDPFDYLDRTSMIDFWIIFELMANHEMLHPKSVYFHKDGAGKLVAGPIWDFDFETLADHRRTGWINFGVESSSLSWMPWAERNWWNVLLTCDATFRADVVERWAEWYPFLQSVPEFIDRERRSIAAAVARDNRRWPEIHAGNENGDLRLSFDEAVDRLESVYRQRAAWLDREISQWGTPGLR